MEFSALAPWQVPLDETERECGPCIWPFRHRVAAALQVAGRGMSRRKRRAHPRSAPPLAQVYRQRTRFSANTMILSYPEKGALPLKLGYNIS